MVHLRWLWTNAVCSVIVVTSGFQTVQPPHQKTSPAIWQVSPAPQLDFYLPMQITNRVFTDALLNPTSDEYQTLYKEVSDLLGSIYDCPDYNTCPTDIFYRGITALTFSSGSVIATPTVVFNTYFIDPSIIHFFFITKANIVQSHTLQLNLDYTTKDKITLATRTTTTTRTATTKLTTTTTTRTTMTATNAATNRETPATPTTARTTISKSMLMFTTTTPVTAHMPTTTLTSTITVKAKTASAPTFMMTTTPKTTTTTCTTASSTTTTITNSTTTNSTAPKIPEFITTTTTTTSDLTSSSTQTKTPSDHRIVVSSAKKLLGHQSGIYITNRKDLAVKTTTVTLQDEHTKSSAKPNGPLTSGDNIKNNWTSDWVPGWGIALLALAAVILILLIIIFVMMLVQYGKITESGYIDTIEDPYYSEKKHTPMDNLQIYTSQPPVTQGPGSTPVIFGDVPRKNCLGFYAVNP